MADGERGRIRGDAVRGAAALLTVLLVVFLAAACGGGGAASGEGGTDVESTGVYRAPPVPPEDVVPYVGSDSALVLPATLRVRVVVDSTAPEDTLVFPVRDFESCGSQFVDRSLVRVGDLLSGAAVWLSGVGAGKENSVRRRFDLVHQNCMLTPRVQTMSSGGTLNVRNMDNAVHVVRFTDMRTGQTLARITQSERGQVIPLDHILDAPRLIEVVCETHTWTRAWLHVFDHPYHGVSGSDGLVVLDSVPQGTHELVAWHERMGEFRRPQNFAAGGRDSVTLLLRPAGGFR